MLLINLSRLEQKVQAFECDQLRSVRPENLSFEAGGDPISALELMLFCFVERIVGSQHVRAPSSFVAAMCRSRYIFR